MFWLILYGYIILCVITNGITSPFNDIGSFFMWAAVVLPIVGLIILFIAMLRDDD